MIRKDTDDGFHEKELVLPHDGHATYDIPAVEGLANAVPHTMASRVAEWALGDQIDVIAHAADVRFGPVPFPLDRSGT